MLNINLNKYFDLMICIYLHHASQHSQNTEHSQSVLDSKGCLVLLAATSSSRANTNTLRLCPLCAFTGWTRLSFTSSTPTRSVSTHPHIRLASDIGFESNSIAFSVLECILCNVPMPEEQQDKEAVHLCHHSDDIRAVVCAHSVCTLRMRAYRA